MPPSVKMQLLERAISSFESAMLDIAAWEALEAPAVVQAVYRCLDVAKSLEEWVAALSAYVKQGH